MKTFTQYILEEISSVKDINSIESDIKEKLLSKKLITDSATFRWGSAGKLSTPPSPTAKIKCLVIRDSWASSRHEVLQYIAAAIGGTYHDKDSHSGEGATYVKTDSCEVRVYCKDLGGKSDTNKDSKIKEDISSYIFIHYNDMVSNKDNEISECVQHLLKKSGIENIASARPKIAQYVTSSLRQREKVISHLKGIDFNKYEIIRGDEAPATSVLGLIYKIAAKNGLKRNLWNPADLVLVKKDKIPELKSNILTLINDDPVVALAEVNAIIEKSLSDDASSDDRVIIPISIKNTTRSDKVSCSTIHAKDSTNLEDYSDMLSKGGFDFDSLRISYSFKNAFIYCKNGFGVRLSARGRSDSTNIVIEGVESGADYRLGAISRQAIENTYPNTLNDDVGEVAKSINIKPQLGEIFKFTPTVLDRKFKRNKSDYEGFFNDLMSAYSNSESSQNKAAIIRAAKMIGIISGFAKVWNEGSDNFEDFMKHMYLFVHRLAIKGTSSYVIVKG